MNFRAAKKTSGDVYINEPVETDKDGNTLTLMDLIDDGNDIHEQVDMLIRSRQLYRFLGNCLDKRELDIIIYRYGLYGSLPHTQNETAEKLGISRSYVKLAIYYKWMANVKITIATIHFFILFKGQAIIRPLHSNFNADIPQL
ncbi:MAG: hypothetical protein IJY29_05190, partial [Ruminococcus sp.]|nr:hypothetical protein [Ruminococcus sp.]